MTMKYNMIILHSNQGDDQSDGVFSNEKFTDLYNKICNLTDRIGTIEECKDKMTSELSSSMSAESSSTEGSNDSAGRKRRTPPELQVNFVCFYIDWSSLFHLH